MRNLILVTFAGVALAAPAFAQTSSTSESARTASGTRVTDTKGIEVNDQRVNSRIENRQSNRLATRVGRYAPVQDPTNSMRTRSVERSLSATTKTTLNPILLPVDPSAFDPGDSLPN